MEQYTKQKLCYYNCLEHHSIYSFCIELFDLVKEQLTKDHTLVLLCIGSDRATGDCLGPIIGYKLSKTKYNNICIYGTLANPVHAKNLDDTIASIYKQFEKPFIIAIDASLGKEKHIGYVTLGNGSLSPGIGVDKELPNVGDIFITGIVNTSGFLNHMMLQTTRLDIVMQLADYICVGLKYMFYQINQTEQELPRT